MRIGKSHPQWQSIIDGWRQTQQEFRQRVIIEPLNPPPRFIAGADCAFSKDGTTVFAAAVIYDREEKRIIEVRHATAPADVPYIPNFYPPSARFGIHSARSVLMDREWPTRAGAGWPRTWG
jgi:hypothetical protein